MSRINAHISNTRIHPADPEEKYDIRGGFFLMAEMFTVFGNNKPGQKKVYSLKKNIFCTTVL
jgi:hypothetical protein